jgi:hypothetical protein
LKDGSVGECAEQVISERAWVMAKEKTKGEELSAIGKQTMAHAYSEQANSLGGLYQSGVGSKPRP